MSSAPSCNVPVRTVLAALDESRRAAVMRDALDEEPVPLKLNEEIARHGGGDKGTRRVARLLGISPERLAQLAEAEEAERR